MADPSHLKVLEQGVDAWNAWREEHREVRPELSHADLSYVNLSYASLYGANLYGANLSHVDLSYTTLATADLSYADLSYADVTHANLPITNLSHADFSHAVLVDASLIGADLSYADLSYADMFAANFTNADLRGADLQNADLTTATFVGTDVTGATFTGCKVYGISAWNLKGEPETQNNLHITEDELDNKPAITVDNLEVAQFISLLTKSEKLRDVIDSVTAKLVLILGTFGERLPVLEAIQEGLRDYKDEKGINPYVPVVFSFDGPKSQDFMTTVRTIAHMSRFAIADLTTPRSVVMEVHDIVPQLEIAVKLIIGQESGDAPPTMLESDLKYEWLIPTIYYYKNVEDLRANLGSHVITPAEKKRRELLNKDGKFTKETS